MSWLSVVGHARIQRAQENLICGGVTDSPGDGDSIFNHRDGNAEFWNAGDKFTRAIERIDDPHSTLFEAGGGIYALFREPAFAIAKQLLAQDGVDRRVSFGNGIVASFVFCLNRAQSEVGKNPSGGIQR